MIAGFDIEIYGEFPEEDTHWKEVDDLVVSCAALSDATKSTGALWYSAPGTNGISDATCAAMLTMLFKISKEHQIVIWNGIGFDLPFLAKMTGEWDLAKKLARRIYDPCYYMLKLYGFPVGLDNTCIGFEIPGKPVGMDGLKAMALWTKPLQRPKVLEYVIQDSAAAAMIGQMISATGEVRWQTKALKMSSRRMMWVPADHYIPLPMADQSWMNRGDKPPLTEDHFTWWL